MLIVAHSWEIFPMAAPSLSIEILAKGHFLFVAFFSPPKGAYGALRARYARVANTEKLPFFLGVAATWRRCDGGHGTRRRMVVGQRGHRSMVARGLSHRRAALRLVGWPRLRPRSQLPPAFEQLALGLTLPR